MKKELSLYKIRDLALASGRSVYSIQQLSNLISKNKATAKVYAQRLVKTGLAIRIMQGKISFTKDEYIIATQMIEPSYISLNSALLFHKLSKQVTKNIECVTTRNTLTYPKLGINYHKIPPSLFHGFKKYSKGESYIFVAEPEKAIIDGLYLSLISTNDLKEYNSALNKNKLKILISNFKGKGSKKLRRILLK